MISKTPGVSLTRDTIRRSATSAIYARGNNYFKTGRVLECVEIEPGVVEGTVRGSGANLYSTNVDFSDGHIISDCSCPYGWSDVCKHAVALALEHLRISSMAGYRQPEPQAAQATFDGHQLPETAAESNKNTAWQEVLDCFVQSTDSDDDKIGSSRVIYRLSIAWYGKLMLRTTRARIGRNGKGKEGFYSFDKYSPSSFLRKKDDAILGLLEYGSFMPSMGIVDDDILDPLLRMLRDEEYVYVGESETKTSINLSPIKAKLVLEEDGDDHLLRLSFEPEEVNKHLESLHVLGQDKPWITNGCAFHPLETKVPGPVLAGLLNQPRTIGKDQIDSFIESYYDLLAQNESVEIKSNLLNNIRNDILPRPVIHLESENGALIVKPYFAYGDGPPQVEPGSTVKVIAVPVEEKSVWARRQIEAEQDIYKKLGEEGVSISANATAGAVDGSSGIGRLYGEAALDFLYNSVDRLQKQGWEIVFKADSIRVNRNTPKVSASVSSGIDWFDLQFNFDYGDMAAELPAVLAAYRSGRKYIRLDDGSWGTLPLEWLEKSNPLLDELDDHDGNRRHKYGSPDNRADVDTAAVRVRNHLIPFVEDMVSDIDLRSIVEFDDLRARLASFNGLDKVDLPAGLNATLRDYQNKGLDWLAFLASFSFSGILADDMGLGKTIQTLAHLLKQKELAADAGVETSVEPGGMGPGAESYARDKQSRSKTSTSLIVAPTSVAYNWKEEAARFTPGLNVLVLTGPDRSAKFDDIPKADIVVTTYALLRRDFETLKTHDFKYVVLDEAQYIKNPAAQTSKLCKTLRASHRLALTGTPIENNLTELWSIFDFLMPGFLGSHQSFRERYEKPIMKAAREADDDDNNGNSNSANINNIKNIKNTKPGLSNDTDHGKVNATVKIAGNETMDRLRKRIKPFILRRLKDEVATELPPKTEMINFCEMTPAQNNLYRQVLNTYRAKVFEALNKKGVERSHITILDALLKLRQVCNHPQLLKIAANNVHTSGKMNALEEMIEQIVSEKHKALVFSQFTQMLGIVRKWLDQNSIPYCYLDGHTRDRRRAINNFNNSDIPLFLISLKAGGTGLNLTAADYVIHIDPWWNPAVENQATDRAYRIGQDKHVFVYKLITKNSLEEKILKLQERKKELVDGLLSEGSIGKSLTREDIDELFSM